MSRLALRAMIVLLLSAGALLLIAASRAGLGSDPYLAAEHFLRRQGLDVIRSEGLAPLAQAPASELSVMLLGDRAYMSPSQAQALLAWVYAGGRLLVTVQGNWAPGGATADALLDPLHIRLLDAYASAGASLTAARTTLTALYLEAAPAPLLLGFAPGRHLEDGDGLAQSWANSPQGTHMLQLNLGAGTLTVVSDTGLWRNLAIGQFDNAWLLWYLNQGRKVVLQYRNPQPTLWQRLTAYPATLVLTLAGLVLLGWALASGRPRHWPARPARARVPSATSARPPAYEPLLRELREDIHHYASRRYPGFAHWPVAEQWQLLARVAGVSTAAIAQVMRPRPGEQLSATAFRQQVSQLQTVRNAL